MQKLNILVAGSTGYIGTELIKLLVNHKNVKIKYLCGNTSIGKNISFYDSLISDSMIKEKISNKDLKKMFDLKYHLRKTNIIFNRIFK